MNVFGGQPLNIFVFKRIWPNIPSIEPHGINNDPLLSAHDHDPPVIYMYGTTDFPKRGPADSVSYDF